LIRGCREQTKQQTNQNERKTMQNQFDELTKNMAQSVTRRAALKKFGVGLAGMALACFGLANRAEAARAVGLSNHKCKHSGSPCGADWACCSGACRGSWFGSGTCV
jgi:hypothetical protein